MINSNLEPKKSSVDLTKKVTKPGGYALKQLFEVGGLISWSHGSRFIKAHHYFQRFKSDTLLDYGCGDGTFLSLVDDANLKLTGIDIDPKQILDCQKRNLNSKTLEFFEISQEFINAHTEFFPLIYCMEVLEHCLDKNIDQVLNNLHSMCKTNGHVVISVPVEIGPSFLVKELFRKLAAIKMVGQYQYKETYSLLEALAMVFATKSTEISRPVYRTNLNDREIEYYGHKGFNWYRLLDRIESKFEVVEIDFSPFSGFRSIMNSQVWFLLKKDLRK